MKQNSGVACAWGDLAMMPKGRKPGSPLSMLLSHPGPLGGGAAIGVLSRLPHTCVSLALPLSEYSAEQTQQALHQSVFMSSVSAHPFRDLPLGREQHCKLLPGVANIQAGEVARWTVDEVSGAVLGPWRDGPCC